MRNETENVDYPTSNGRRRCEST